MRFSWTISEKNQMTNNLEKLRVETGISRKQLAEMVGATQLTIQRIESGKYLPRLELAIALSAALEEPLDAVFPGADKVLVTLNAKPAGDKIPLDDRCEMLRDVGIEGDIRQHELKVWLRGHQQAMFFPIQANEVSRIFQAVQGEAEGSSFIVFDSNHLRVAINLKSTMFCHFLWDVEYGHEGGSPPPDVPPDEDDPRESVQVYFAENSVPITLGVEAENGDDIDDENNYLNNVFGLLENDMPPHERLHIVDENGESAFIRVGDVTLLTVPLWVLGPDERVWDDENES
jgi:DNA-binding XRE family transcriptional regulator